MAELTTRIKELRNSRNLTLKEMAKDLAIRDNTLSQYENDKRSVPLEMAKFIADYFNVSLDYLFRNSDIKNHTFKDEKSAIDLINKIENKKINYDQLSLHTLMELSTWVAENIEQFGTQGKYNEYLHSVYLLIEHVRLEEKSLITFGEAHIKNKKIDDIVEILKNENVDVIYNLILESKKVPIELTNTLLEVMKKFKNSDLEDDKDYSLNDVQITKIASFISSLNDMPLKDNP